MKERQKGREDKEEDVNSYWMTVGKDKILEYDRGSSRLPSA
jgi:hypothetical protein